MTKILVIAESSTERRLIKNLLHSGLGAEVVAVASAPEALLEAAAARFDLVVTELNPPAEVEPGIVSAFQDGAFSVPVVVLTVYGTETHFMAALRAGASSYVPKCLLHEHLVDTCQTVLHASSSAKRRKQVQATIAYRETRYELANSPELISPLVNCIQDELTGSLGFSESDTLRVGIALHETLSNAIYHGNLDVSSDLRQDDETEFHNLAAVRMQTMPYRLRRVHVTTITSPDEFRVTVRDDGVGYDVVKALAKAEDPDLDRIGGRGLLLVHSFMDEVVHNQRGNEVTMIKYAPLAPNPASYPEADTSEELPVFQVEETLA
jgi:anti-sigma regulatory factor (Ser/Thr protein kinase)/DNA-binding NarL/FixJ family response regulator